MCGRRKSGRKRISGVYLLIVGGGDVDESDDDDDEGEEAGRDP